MVNRNRGGAGGGINSNKRVERPVKTGSRAEAISERGTSQIGQSLGNHITDRRGTVSGAVEKVRGELRAPGQPGSVPLGNQIAGNVGKCGPGTGRRLYGKSGSQCQTGPANPGLGRITNTKGQWPD
jgi:hypothetical protein